MNGPSIASVAALAALALTAASCSNSPLPSPTQDEAMLVNAAGAAHAYKVKMVASQSSLEDATRSYAGQHGDDTHPDWLLGYFTVFESTPENGCGTTSGTTHTPDGYWTDGADEGWSGGTWSYANGILTATVLEDGADPVTNTMRVRQTPTGFAIRISDGRGGSFETMMHRCGEASIELDEFERLQRLRGTANAE